MSIPLTKPFIRRKDMDAVLSCLVEDRLEPGDVVKKLITELSLFLKTDGGSLYLDPLVGSKALFNAMGLGPGDGVIVSPFTPSYVIAAGLELGLVFLRADVELLSPVISPISVQQLLDQNPKAIYADSTLGFLPDIGAFKDMNLLVIEDITHSLGGFRDLELSGSRGDFVVSYFGTSSSLNAGGGFLVLVGRRKFAQEAKKTLETVLDTSLMGDMNAALALGQFHHLEKNIQRKNEIFRYFLQKMHKGHRVPVQTGETEAVYPWFPVLLESGAKEVIAYAKKKGIEARLAFNPGEEPWPEQLPNARSFAFRCILFPLHPGLTMKETELIAKVLGTLP